MTTIAAVQGKTWAVIGYDARAVEGTKKFTLTEGVSKCFEVDGYIIGMAGSLRAINIATYSFTPPDAGKKRGTDLDRFIQTRFIPELKRAFDKSEFTSSDSTPMLMLVVVNATIYEIGVDYAFLRDTDGLYAIGSGSEYALGVLHALDDTPRKVGKARENIEVAMGIAGRLDTGTSDTSTHITQHWKVSDISDT